MTDLEIFKFIEDNGGDMLGLTPMCVLDGECEWAILHTGEVGDGVAHAIMDAASIKLWAAKGQFHKIDISSNSNGIPYSDCSSDSGHTWVGESYKIRESVVEAMKWALKGGGKA